MQKNIYKDYYAYIIYVWSYKISRREHTLYIHPPILKKPHKLTFNSITRPIILSYLNPRDSRSFSLVSKLFNDTFKLLLNGVANDNKIYDIDIYNRWFVVPIAQHRRYNYLIEQLFRYGRHSDSSPQIIADMHHKIHTKCLTKNSRTKTLKTNYKILSLYRNIGVDLMDLMDPQF